MSIEYEPDSASKARETLVKTPYIDEYNAKGAEFRDKKITPKEWEAFRKGWKKEFKLATHEKVKIRTYRQISAQEL